MVFKAFTKQTPIKDLEIFVEIAEYRWFKLDDLKKIIKQYEKELKNKNEKKHYEIKFLEEMWKKSKEKK